MNRTPTQTIIELKNLTKNFGEHTILHDINLKVKSGEFLTLLGASGCGKSTLLRLIAGLDYPTEGSIYIEDQEITYTPPYQRHINMVFQNYALFPHMTVFDNVAFGLYCKHMPFDLIQEKVERLLKLVKLDHLKQRKPAQLSGGEQQRVAIARAVINEPLVLLLDEPLSALDYRLRKEMQIGLKNLQRQLGITFVLVTHDQEEALSMSDRVVVMSTGKIEQIGTPRAVYEHPRNMYVAKFIGATNIFETQVAAVMDDKIQVNIEDKLFTLESSTQFVKDQNINIIVRPEDLKSWDITEITAEEKEEMIPAVVEQVIYKGSTVDLILRTPSGKRLSTTEFFDEDDEDLDFKIGEHVWIEWALGWEVVLNAE